MLPTEAAVIQHTKPPPPRLALCLLLPHFPVPCAGTVKLSRQGLAGANAPTAGPAAAALQINSITQVLTKKNDYPNGGASPVLSMFAKNLPQAGSGPSAVPPGTRTCLRGIPRCCAKHSHSPTPISPHPGLQDPGSGFCTQPPLLFNRQLISILQAYLQLS